MIREENSTEIDSNFTARETQGFWIDLCFPKIPDLSVVTFFYVFLYWKRSAYQSETKYVVFLNFQRSCINDIVWYQAIHSKKCRSNCLFIQIVLAFVAIKYIEFQKCSFICLDILKRWYFDLDWKTLFNKIRD